MPYISRVYKELSENNDEFLNSCLKEQADGNIPLVITEGRKTLRLFVSPDVTVNYILNSFYDESIKNIKTNAKIYYVTYNAEKQVYENGEIVHDYEVPLQELSNQRMKLIIMS